MPLPFILGGIALAAGGLTVCGKINNADLKADINKTYEKAQELVNETNEKLIKSECKLNTAIEYCEKEKENVSSNEIAEFVQYFGQIKNINIKESQGNNFLSKIEKIDVSYIEQFKIPMTTGAKIKEASKLAVTYAFLGTVGTLFGTVSETYKLEDEQRVAKGRLKEVEVDCEKKILKISMFNEMRKQTNEVKSVITNLRPVMNESNSFVKELIHERGTDYTQYSAKQKQLLFCAINIAAGINDLLVRPLITKNGSFNKELIPIMSEVKKLGFNME